MSKNIRPGVYSPILPSLLQAYENWLVSTVENTPELTKHGQQYDRGLHAAIGLATEAPEILDLFKKQLFGKMVTGGREKLVDEMGDLFWYFTLLMNASGVTMQEIITHNVEKLCDRYGHAGFDLGNVYIGGTGEICSVCGETKGHCND